MRAGRIYSVAYIPKDLIGPVAEVLRWVQSLQRQ